MHRIAVLLAGVVAAAVLVSSAGTATTTRLTGTVGPGFTITLKKGGKLVRGLKAGRYRIVVTDRSDDHNFHLKGPGVNKRITTVAFEGVRSATVRLRRGTYRYVCDPHIPSMTGRFVVR